MNSLDSISQPDLVEAEKLATLVRALNQAGHNPATSGNYSLRSKTLPGVSLISESGVDKSLFTEKNFLLVDQQTGELVGKFKNSGRKSSDETAIHLTIYRATDAGCILHSHMLEALLFADLFPGQEILSLENLELLKGFKGVRSHETRVLLPSFANSQDIQGLANKAEPLLKELVCFGLLLRGHGLYVWGETVNDAKRHLEVFEYIFKYYIATSRNRNV